MTNVMLSCCLAPDTKASVAYEAPYLHDILRDETTQRSLLHYRDRHRPRGHCHEGAVQAGIRRGDEIVSIDGRPYRGVADWARPFAGTSIGGSIA